MAKILVIDDEAAIRSSLKSALERRGHSVATAASYAEGASVRAVEFDLTLLDVMLGDGNGIDLLRELRREDPSRLVVMISGHADIDMAVDATKAGAYDFIEKPLSLDRILITLENALKTKTLRAETERLATLVYGDFVGASPAMQALRADIKKAAGRTDRFLVLGENGTGKELVAHMIHRNSARGDGPFVAVNCAALPSNLIESELFGHVKGAFTGASRDRKGKFVESHGGSIFLDEISEMPLEAQTKILRAIETRTVSPLGSEKTAAVEVNIIAASNRNLEEMVAQGSFREDLYYRLNVVQFRLPPLRERGDDIGRLAEHFLARFAREAGSAAPKLETSAREILQRYPFPGNVRELKNLMERVSIYCDTDRVRAGDIRRLLPRTRQKKLHTLREAVAQFEREYIEEAVARNNGNMSETARQLGIERSHLYKKIKRYRREQ